MKQSIRNLFVWTASVDVAVQILRLTSTFQNYALANQMQRAAISVPSNIAEGRGRLTLREQRRYLGIARGSLYELETQLEICARAALMTPEALSVLREQTAKIGAGLSRLIDKYA